MQNEYNFDCPEAFDTECIVNTLRRLKEGKSVEIPVYNFSTHRADKKKVELLTLFAAVTFLSYNRTYVVFSFKLLCCFK